MYDCDAREAAPGHRGTAPPLSRAGGRMRRLASMLVALLSLALPCAAQVTGDDAPPPRRITSVRPVLVDVEFDGNNDNDLNDKVLKAQIKSRPTERPALRIFSVFARVYDLPFMPQSMRDEVHSIVDSLSGEERYFNPRLLREDTMELRRVYEKFGYNEVELDYRVIIDTARNRSKIRYFIEEGPRYENRGITYLGVEEVPEEVREQFREPEAFEIGDEFVESDIIAETGRAVGTLHNHGYPFATRTDVWTLKHNDTVRGLRYDSTLVSIYTGNRYRFGRTEYRPDDESEGPKLKEEVVLQQIEYEPGEWYSRLKVDQTLANLYGLGVFEYVRLDSLSEATTDSTLGMQLVTKLIDPRVLTLTPELAFERYIREYYTFIGASAMFTHANLWGGAEKLTARVHARLPLSELDAVNASRFLTYGGSVSYLDQTLLRNIFGRRWSIGAALGYDRAIEDRLFDTAGGVENTYALTSQRLYGSLELSHRFPAHTFISNGSIRLTPQYLAYRDVTEYLRKKAEQRAEGLTGLSETEENRVIEEVRRALAEQIFYEQVWLGDDVDAVTNPDVREHFDQLKWSLVLSVFGNADHRDDFFSPRNGDAFDGRLELGTNGFVNKWVKVEGDYRRFFPWDDDKTIGVRGHLGVIFPIGPIKLVPLTSRFWAGGANSLRGWGPREMLVTEFERNELTGVGGRLVDEVFEDARSLLGGLAIAEIMGDWRWRPFNFPATSTLIQQINQLMMIAGLDAGGAFFRNPDEEAVTWKRFIDGIGISASLAIGYDTPIGPIRFGFGYPLRDPIRYGRMQDGSPGQPWFWERRFTIRDFSWFFAIAHAF